MGYADEQRKTTTRLVQLGHYETAGGRRELEAIASGDALHVVDRGPGDDLLVEPAIEGLSEARALALDYLRARERRAPLVREPWPLEVEAFDRSETASSEVAR